jgi:hypothetical protein
VNSSKGPSSYREGNTLSQRNATIERSRMSVIGRSGVSSVEVSKKEGAGIERVNKEQSDN